jgi:hypothetical protein
MATRTTCSWFTACACLLVACPKDVDSPNPDAGHAAAGAGRTAGSHSVSGGGGAGQAGHASGTGGKGAGGAGSNAAGSGGAGGNGCPRDIAIPALCRVCDDGSCGTPSCSGGKFVGFVCLNDADGGTLDAGTSAADGGTVDAGTTAALHWVESCGAPVCQAGGPYDDPNIPNCTTEKVGQSCTTDGQRCDGVATCGATLLCATQAPQTCPRSRAEYKENIRYLGAAERAQFHDQIAQLPLASYRYKNAPDVPQLGFMIDDVEPSVAVSGDRVNLYAYLSMAVAAIQVQDQRIQELQLQVERLRVQIDTESRTCGPEPQRSGITDTLRR